MLNKSDPPIASTSISPYLEEHAFRSGLSIVCRGGADLPELAICFDASKAKNLLGYQPIVPSVEVDELRRVVEEFQKDRLW